MVSKAVASSFVPFLFPSFLPQKGLTDDGPGAEANSGPLPLETPVEDEPGNTSNGSGEVGDDAGRDGSEVGGESGSSVESKPSEPE